MAGKFFGLFVAVTALVLGLQSAEAAYCNGSPDPGERTNDYPIFDAKLRHIRSVKNAMLFEAGPPNATFPVVHLWGTPYEVGYAQGELIGPMIKEFVYRTWQYLSVEMLEELDDLPIPEFAKKLIVQKGLDRALDWTRDTTAAFTPQAYYDEVRGIADATGMDYDLLYRLQMFPELTKAHCSFFGAWESAVG
jgi:isopenicillin-N N-acyltransferase-like protein